MTFISLAKLEAPNALRIVLSDDVTLEEGIAAARLGARLLPKKNAFDSLSTFAQFLVSEATREECKERRATFEAPPSVRFLEDLAHSRTTFKSEREELDRLALMRLMKCPTIADVARGLGDSPSTIRSRMKKLGLSLIGG